MDLKAFLSHLDSLDSEKEIKKELDLSRFESICRFFSHVFEDLLAQVEPQRSRSTEEGSERSRVPSGPGTRTE